VDGVPVGAGAALEEKAVTFLGVASGSGVEVPEWLERLGAAVDRAIERADAAPRRGGAAGRIATSLPDCIRWLPVPWSAVHAALAE
jgi:hypothetical protein